MGVNRITRDDNPAMRAEALALGCVLVGRGYRVPIRTMSDGHVLDALLTAVSESDEAMTAAMAREVERRGLRAEALAMASARDSV